MSARLLPGTRLVRAFSAVDATAIAASSSRRSDLLGVPLAGDDAQAVATASQLVRDAGCEPVVAEIFQPLAAFSVEAPAFVPIPMRLRFGVCSDYQITRNAGFHTPVDPETPDAKAQTRQQRP